MPAKGDTASATKSAVALGTIDIRENPAQDISALSRDTANSLNELGRIFDKKTVEEQQELAAVFGEEGSREAARHGSLSPPFLAMASSRKYAVHMSTRLTEASPIGLSPSGLTSRGFMVNYTHKRPLCGHCAPPLQKPSRSASPLWA